MDIGEKHHWEAVIAELGNRLIRPSMTKLTI